MAGTATRSCQICLCVRNSSKFHTKKQLHVLPQPIIYPLQSRSIITTTTLLNPNQQRIPKKRDKYTVLKALSSTVGELPDRPDYRFFDDVILNARTSIKTRELDLAIQSGTKAAEYVLEQYPDLVQLREPVPAWPKSEKLPSDIEPTVENLRLIIKCNERVPKLMEIYESLNSKGDLSLEMKNEVLEFASFHALSSSMTTDSNTAIQENDSSSSSSSSSSSGEESESVNKSSFSTWRNDGFAETLFEELKEQGNVQTYEVFMLGLLKHGEYIRAFHLFKEFQDKGFSGSLHLYETLIKHVVDVRQGDQDRWEFVEEIVASMKVKPTSATFATLMSVAIQQESGVSKLCQRLFGEMKKLNITPSLGTLYHLLAGERKEFETQKNYIQNIRILYMCVDELQSGNVDLQLTHPSDVEFFEMAMHLARFKRVGEVAEKIFNVITQSNLHHMLGVRAKQFYGNFLAAIARSPKDMESVYKHYETIVPNYLIPHDWVYEQLFFASRNNQDISYVPRFYNDMSKYNVYLMNKKLLPALYLALDMPIPQENAAEFLGIVEGSKYAIENIDVTDEVRQNMISTAMNIYCLNGKPHEAIEVAKYHKLLGTMPTFKSLLKVLTVNISQEDKKSAMQTLKFMSSMSFQYDDLLDETINNSFLQSERERVMLWFAN